MTPIELLAWLGALAAGLLVMILFYAFLSVLWKDLVAKPRAQRRHLKAMNEFAQQLREMAAKHSLVLPSDVLKGGGASTEAQEEIHRNGNGQS